MPAPSQHSLPRRGIGVPGFPAVVAGLRLCLPRWGGSSCPIAVWEAIPIPLSLHLIKGFLMGPRCGLCWGPGSPDAWLLWAGVCVPPPAVNNFLPSLSLPPQLPVLRGRGRMGGGGRGVGGAGRASRQPGCTDGATAPAPGRSQGGGTLKPWPFRPAQWAGSQWWRMSCPHAGWTCGCGHVPQGEGVGAGTAPGHLGS